MLCKCSPARRRGWLGAPVSDRHRPPPAGERVLAARTDGATPCSSSIRPGGSTWLRPSGPRAGQRPALQACGPSGRVGLRLGPVFSCPAGCAGGRAHGRFSRWGLHLHSNWAGAPAVAAVEFGDGPGDRTVRIRGPNRTFRVARSFPGRAATPAFHFPIPAKELQTLMAKAKHYIPDRANAVTPYLVVRDGQGGARLVPEGAWRDRGFLDGRPGRRGHARGTPLRREPDLPRPGVPRSPGRGRFRLPRDPRRDEHHDPPLHARTWTQSTPPPSPRAPTRSVLPRTSSGVTAMSNIVDPFGHRWSLSTHVEDLTEEELEARAQAAACGIRGAAVVPDGMR